MPRKSPDFTHRDKFSGYMAVVAEAIGEGRNRSLLDLPAGAGHFGDAMAERGFRVTHADFNRDRPEYVQVDINKPLPIDDASFDVVTCLEGIEHTLSDAHTLFELARVCTPGGTIVISTPNTAHLLSRVRYLFTGTYFHFHPMEMRDAALDAAIDRGHIMPIHLPRLIYLARQVDLELVEVRTDKWKRKVLYPLHLLTMALSVVMRRGLFSERRGIQVPEKKRRLYYRVMYSNAVMMGRTLIAVFEKRAR